MVIWHLEDDTLRSPDVVRAGEGVALWVGTHPIEPGQYVKVEWRKTAANGSHESGKMEAFWQWNEDWRSNSYWLATFGPFGEGDKVEYVIRGDSRDGEVSTVVFEFEVHKSDEETSGE
ncbi:MAG: hypothetical protein HY276_11230 [Ignavibacteriales bacterium]|nr:hypothetical protein [Ignavibacteriales bacterium]MBI3788811.1 hypothetical protein [Ignavibacteriales bacterium]